MKKFKKLRYYAQRFPQNTLQKAAHRAACARVIEYYKGSNVHVTKKSIETILKAVHMYAHSAFVHMHEWSEKEDPSVVHLHFGYIRKIFPRLFFQMKDNGEFTAEEWDVIRNEFYKKELDVYEELINNRAIWKKRKQKEWDEKQKS